MKKILFLLGFLTLGKCYAQKIANEISMLQTDPQKKLLAVGYKDGLIELYSLKGRPKLLGKTDYIKQTTDIKSNTLLSICFVKNTYVFFVLYHHNRIAFLSSENCNLEIANDIHIDMMYQSRKGDEIINLADVNYDHSLLAIAGYEDKRIVLIDLHKLFDVCDRRPENIITRSFTTMELGYGMLVSQKSEQPANITIKAGLNIYDQISSRLTAFKISPNGKFVFAGTNSGKIYKFILPANDSLEMKPSGFVIAGFNAPASARSVLDLAASKDYVISSTPPNLKFGTFQVWHSTDLSIFQHKTDAIFNELGLTETGKILMAKNKGSYFLKKEVNNGFQSNYKIAPEGNSKFTCYKFLENNKLAIADEKNVYFFDLSDMQYLYALNPTDSHPFVKPIIKN